MVSNVDDITQLFRSYVSSECQPISGQPFGFSKIVLVQGRFNFGNYFSFHITIDDSELTILAPRELAKLARTFLARELNFDISSKYGCCAAAAMLFRIAIQNIIKDDDVRCRHLQHCADVLFTSAVVGDELKISKIFRFNIEKLIDCHISNVGDCGDALIDYICDNVDSESSVESAISKLFPHGEYNRQLKLLLDSGFLKLCCAVILEATVGDEVVRNNDNAIRYEAIGDIISNIRWERLCRYLNVYQIRISELEEEIAKLGQEALDLEVNINGSLSISYFSEQQEVFKKTLQEKKGLLQAKIEACSSLRSYFSIIENYLRNYNVDASKEKSYSDNVSQSLESIFGAETVDLFSYSEDSDNYMNIKLNFNSVKTTATEDVRTQVDDFMDSISFTAIASILYPPIFDMLPQYSFNTNPIDGFKLGKHVLQLNSNNSTLELEHIWPYPKLYMNKGLRYKINFTPKCHRDSKIEVFVLNGENTRLGAYFLTKNALNNIAVNCLHAKFGTISHDIESVFIANNVDPKLRTKLVLSCSAEDGESIFLFERVSESLSQSNCTQNLEVFKKLIGDLTGTMNNIICSQGRIFKGVEMSDDLLRQLARGANLFGSYDDGNVSRYLFVMGVPMIVAPMEELQRESLSWIEHPSTLITEGVSVIDGATNQRLL